LGLFLEQYPVNHARCCEMIGSTQPSDQSVGAECFCGAQTTSTSQCCGARDRR
jgi:hypothetical protein